jgi:hypothetical protein
MSDTLKTDKARLARKLTRKFLADFNSGRRHALNQTLGKLTALQVNGTRFGVQRHAMAREKVIYRRLERKALNREVASLAMH